MRNVYDTYVYTPTRHRDSMIPSAAHRRPAPSAAVRRPPPSAAVRRCRPSTTDRQPPTADRPPSAAVRRPPPSAAIRRCRPPTAERQMYILHGCPPFGMSLGFGSKAQTCAALHSTGSDCPKTVFTGDGKQRSFFTGDAGAAKISQKYSQGTVKSIKPETPQRR
jgi:hypothetical protein